MIKFSKAFYNKTTILEFPNSHFKSKLFCNQNKPHKINITTLSAGQEYTEFLVTHTQRISSHVNLLHTTNQTTGRFASHDGCVVPRIISSPLQLTRSTSNPAYLGYILNLFHIRKDTREDSASASVFLRRAMKVCATTKIQFN